MDASSQARRPEQQQRQSTDNQWIKRSSSIRDALLLWVLMIGPILIHAGLLVYGILYPRWYNLVPSFGALFVSQRYLIPMIERLQDRLLRQQREQRRKTR